MTIGSKTCRHWFNHPTMSPPLRDGAAISSLSCPLRDTVPRLVANVIELS
jgi:hypothetical protein